MSQRRWMGVGAAIGVCGWWIVPAIAEAAPAQPISRPILMMLVLAAMSLIPFFVVMVTSFVKLAVVFSIIRSAIGTQQIPPNQVVTGLSFVLTIYIMIPVALDVQRETKPLITRQTGQPFMSDASLDLLGKAVDKGKEPLRGFLLKHAHPKDMELFYSLARNMRRPEDRESLAKQDFSVLVPAFVTSELKEAFQIGFVIFLPFVVIDMVVANVLLAMGMFMLSPMMISLPFKLLLFVLVDGWYLVAKGLILGYQ